MPDISRITEIAVYSLLNFLPFLFLALYPFRRSLRFSKKTTAVLIHYVVTRLIFEQNKTLELKEKIISLLCRRYSTTV